MLHKATHKDTLAIDEYTINAKQKKVIFLGMSHCGGVMRDQHEHFCVGAKTAP